MGKSSIMDSERYFLHIFLLQTVLIARSNVLRCDSEALTIQKNLIFYLVGILIHFRSVFGNGGSVFVSRR